MVSRPEELPKPLRVFLYMNVLLAVVCAMVLAVNVFVRHREYPYDTPFLWFNHFIDFYDFRGRFRHYHQLDFFTTSGVTVFSYPPPVGLLYAFFYLPRGGAHSLFTIITTPPLFYLAWLLRKAIILRDVEPRFATLFVASACLFSFPFWFEYLLGNVEVCIFVMVATAIIAFLRGHLYLAAGLIGIAGSMKLFPFILLGLFLSRRQYRQMAFGFLAAGILYPIAMWIECPNFPLAISGMRGGAKAISQGLVLQWHQAETAFDHSIFGFYKQVSHLLGYSNMQPPGRVTIYMAIAAVFGTVLYFVKIRRLPILNQILALLIACVVLPPMSHDYTLLHLYIPWALLVLVSLETAREGRQVPGMLAAFVCFGILFSPESEIIIKGAAIAGQIKAVTLVALWYISLKYPFQLPESLQSNELEFQADSTTPAVA